MQFKTYDATYDGVLVRTCSFCFADQNSPNHAKECQDLVDSWVAEFGTPPPESDDIDPAIFDAQAFIEWSLQQR